MQSTEYPTLIDTSRECAATCIALVCRLPANGAYENNEVADSNEVAAKDTDEGKWKKNY